MTFVTWNDDFLLHVDQFDEHHKHLVDLLNETYEKFVNKTVDLSLEKLFDELIDYATYHFSAEEYWMQAKQYPGYEEHKKEHAYFTKRVVEMHRDFVAGNTSLGLEVLTFIKNWVANHILNSDAEYGRFINKR
ncbi:bacteriohemerythrin [Desulfuromonas acetoxidans]|uniref:Hemerythrin-like, metal-binding n=1 Tax=Desulfuromonas acetoxidans (strain DSM 684 / 11070) TaxID=281689 RepID=Q1K2A7_DESA6|nr:bacteriohemerythrin [Desulfuromonas acetoxidans]EAT16532.1 Hemerythrin-like, metal-binding [Desulfuromonas acetoxidans DSM 684]MBF0647057.1 hemerythrin family protein [Desulfuromonas acetoxidans]NVD24643.1 hemerythrin family protein [Desulfuromonas acetoxidans]NVE16688.1 hemerythrin family protein [Desulfuromonas acetoxidans]